MIQNDVEVAHHQEGIDQDHQEEDLDHQGDHGQGIISHVY